MRAAKRRCKMLPNGTPRNRHEEASRPYRGDRGRFRRSLTEFRGLMLELDRHMHDSSVTTTFLAIDSDRDGRIGFTEFRAWWLRD